MIKWDKDEIDKYTKRIGEYERLTDKLNIEKESYLRTIDIQKKQMLE